MTQPLPWTIIFPVLLQLLQVILFLAVAFTLLRMQKILVSPIGGMDYANAAVSAAILLGVLIIASESSENMIRAFKTAQRGDWKGIILTFSRFFVITLLGEIVLLVTTVSIVTFLSKGKDENTLVEGNLPLALLCGGITIGIAVAVNSISHPIYDWLTPVYVNFR